MSRDDFIPNQWYPVFDSVRLKSGRAVGITRLDQRLVLWRDASGGVVCMKDRCPHRAAQLSLDRSAPGASYVRFTGCALMPPADAC